MDNGALLKRIEERAAELGKSIRAVSKEATGSDDTIRNWQRKLKTGETFSMRHASLQAVANALSVDLQWLQTGEFEILGLEGTGFEEETREFTPKQQHTDAVRALFGDKAKKAEIARRMVINMPGLGLAEGDLVVCDLGRDPEHGETVLVHVQDGRANGSTLIRRWFSPWLLAFDPNIDSDPLQEGEMGVTIRYPVVGSIRGA